MDDEKELLELMGEVARRLVSEQKDLPADFQKILYDNPSDLYSK